MLGWRLFLSAILIPLLIAIFYFDNRFGGSAPLLFGFCLLLAIRGVWELVQLLSVRSFEPHFPATVICSVGLLVATWLPHWGLLPISESSVVAPAGVTFIAYLLSVLVLFLLAAARYREPGKNLETLAVEILIVTYIGVLLSATAQLRWVAGSDAGYLALGSLIVAAKCGDSSAYFLGRMFGKRKMSPHLSPGKTWMGAVGAVLGSGLGSWAWLHYATPQFNPNWQSCAWYWSVLYGVIIGIVGLIGDLCESLLKRDAGKKDSASLMPGFGGLLDLLDSVIYAGPIAYLLWLILPLATWQ